MQVLYSIRVDWFSVLYLFGFVITVCCKGEDQPNKRADPNRSPVSVMLGNGRQE